MFVDETVVGKWFGWRSVGVVPLEGLTVGVSLDDLTVVGI